MYHRLVNLICTLLGGNQIGSIQSTQLTTLQKCMNPNLFHSQNCSRCPVQQFVEKWESQIKNIKKRYKIISPRPLSWTLSFVQGPLISLMTMVSYHLSSPVPLVKRINKPRYWSTNGNLGHQWYPLHLGTSGRSRLSHFQYQSAQATACHNPSRCLWQSSHCWWWRRCSWGVTR